MSFLCSILLLLQIFVSSFQSSMADVDSHDIANCPLNVLAVDADENSLLSLEKVLEDCNHKVAVTTCKEAEQCLTILGDRETKFHLVIIDVDLPTTDGYELCSLIRKENDIPIILMSSTYTNVDTVQKALNHGASDFLLKPIKVEILRKINLHALQNRAAENDDDLIKKEWSYGEEEQEVSVPNDEQDVNNHVSIEKRKGDSGLDPRSGKKSRVIWTPELHQKFVEAVNSYGLEKAVPKKILERMGIPSLSRENVASHLQKFRQYKRQQEDSQPNQEKQPRRRRQQQQQEQHQCKLNEAMLDHEPKPHDFKIESQALGLTDPTIQQADLIQVPLYHHPHNHHTIHDTTYEALIGSKMGPTYEALMGLRYVDSTNELYQQHSLQSFHDQSMMPKIEPSYDQSHNLIEESYDYGISIHNASMDPTLTQIGHPQNMLNSVGYDLAALDVNLLNQGGSVANQPDQVNQYQMNQYQMNQIKDNAEAQEFHLKDFNI